MAVNINLADYNWEAFRVVRECRLCDSTDLTEALKLPDTPLANELDGTELFPLCVNRCGSCGHHQLSIAVAPERLWGPGYPYQSGTSPVFRAHLEALADEVAALKPGPAWALEIGSNDGTLCRLLAERGLKAHGVDPSGPDTVGEPGWPALHRESWPWAPQASKFDVILALNVFAHVDDLHSFTAAVKEALAPDGVFIVEVGGFLDVTRLGLFDVIYHEHMSYWGAREFVSFMFRSGLRVAEIKHTMSQGGSYRFYVKHQGATTLMKGGLEVIASPPMAEDLRPIIDSRAAALREALNRLFYRGEMVCIYGAPAKLTTLLYATGLEKMPFNCVGDDNPRKVGRTTPGNHIPIVSVEDMLARKPDTILVASWNFWGDIVKKLRGMGFKGGILNPMQQTDWESVLTTGELRP